MATYRERLAAYDFVDRNVKRATTYTRKAAHLLWAYDKEMLPARPTSYWTLLDQTIQTATDIVRALPNDFFESTETPDYFGMRAVLGDWRSKSSLSDEPYEATQKLLRAFEERRKGAQRAALIARLEDTTGRTPEEAALYQAKADKLRRNA